MKRWIQTGIAALCLLIAPVVLAQIWEATRIGQQQWELVTEEGEHISWHQSEAEAVEHGQAWSLENDLATFITRHTGTRWVATAEAQGILVLRSDLSGVGDPPPVGDCSTLTPFAKGNSQVTCEETDASTYTLSVSGVWDEEPGGGYITFSDTNDFEFVATVPDTSSWTGIDPIPRWAGPGVGISEGLADGAYFFHTWWRDQTNLRPACKFGVPGNRTENPSSAGATLPQAIAVNIIDDEWRCWEFHNDQWIQIGSTVSRVPDCTNDTCIAYILVTSANSSTPMTVPFTSVSWTTTPTILPPAGGGGGGGPAEGTMYDRGFDGISREGASGANEPT